MILVGNKDKRESIFFFQWTVQQPYIINGLDQQQPYVIDGKGVYSVIRRNEMKLKFKILGQTIFTPALGVFSLFMPYLLITGSTLNTSDKLIWSIYFGALILFVNYFLWNKILTQLISVNFQNEFVECLNIVTRKRKSIPVSSIKGYNDEYSGEWIVKIIGMNDEVLLTLRQHYYSNFDEFGQHLNLKYLGRVPSLFRRFWNILTKKKFS